MGGGRGAPWLPPTSQSTTSSGRSSTRCTRTRQGGMALHSSTGRTNPASEPARPPPMTTTMTCTHDADELWQHSPAHLVLVACYGWFPVRLAKSATGRTNPASEPAPPPPMTTTMTCTHEDGKWYQHISAQFCLLAELCQHISALHDWCLLRLASARVEERPSASCSKPIVWLQEDEYGA